MRTLQIGLLVKTEIKLYQDIDETPIELYNLFNEYSLKESELGNTMADVDKKHKNLATLIVKKKNEDAVQALNNLYQTYWSILSHVNYKSLCFGCLIHSIDGEKIEDYSEDSLRELLKGLSKKGLIMKTVKEEIDGIKKNFKHN